MSSLKILVIDDQLGIPSMEQESFLANLETLGKRVSVQFLFCRGQEVSRTKVVNSQDRVIEFVNQHYVPNATLVLLDVMFDSGEIDDQGFLSGNPSDQQFGEKLFLGLQKEFAQALPIIFVTSKPQVENSVKNAPYLHKVSLNTQNLIRCIIEFNLLDINITKQLIGLPGNVICNSRQLLDCFSQVYLHAANSNSLLITGESGTGKELLTQFVSQQHYKGEFVGIDIGTTPAELAEAEWFGIEKGTATGVERRIGKFELANNGILFLDEIADIELTLQAKLLRVIETKSLYRVGGRKRIPLNFKLIAATSKDLKQRVEQGRFREDLYYRIADITIKIPPLRQRKEDIKGLAEHWLNYLCHELGISHVQLAPEAINYICNLPLKGNAREIRSILAQALAGASSYSYIDMNRISQIQSLQNKIIATGSQNNADNHASEDFYELLDKLEKVSIPNQPNELLGIVPKLDSTIETIRLKLVQQALILSQHPVNNKYNKQRAAQLLSENNALTGQEPNRFLNKQLNYKLNKPLTQQDCIEIVKLNLKGDKS